MWNFKVTARNKKCTKFFLVCELALKNSQQERAAKFREYTQFIYSF